MALFSFAVGPLKPVFEQSYASGSYADLGSIISDFLKKTRKMVALLLFILLFISFASNNLIKDFN